MNYNESYFEKLYHIEQQEEILVGEFRHGCGCTNLEIRLRKIGNGTHYVRQCQDCGRQKWGPLKKDLAEIELNGNPALPFDTEIEEEIRLHNSLISEQLSVLKEEKEQIQLETGSYVSFGESYRVEQQKYEDANVELAEFMSGFKEEFGLERAINALMKQTVELKKLKYQQHKETVNRFHSEIELKDWLSFNLSSDFNIYPEVWGSHLSEGINVRIDFILTAKEHLVAKGFDPSPFGIEVKYIKQEDGFTRKSSRALWQTISYMDSMFNIGERRVKLKFSLLFSNLSFSDEFDLLKNYGVHSENDQLEWRAMQNVANHARVGTLQILGQKNNFIGWRMYFAGGVYFVAQLKNGDISYRKSNGDVVNKVRVGNF